MTFMQLYPDAELADYWSERDRYHPGNRFLPDLSPAATVRANLGNHRGVSANVPPSPNSASPKRLSDSRHILEASRQCSEMSVARILKKYGDI